MASVRLATIKALREKFHTAMQNFSLAKYYYHKHVANMYIASCVPGCSGFHKYMHIIY